MPHTRASGGDLIWRPTRLAIYARDGFECVACEWSPQDAVELVMLAEVIRRGWPSEELHHRLHGAITTGRAATLGLTLDHVRPPSRGGHLSYPANLVTLCSSCNSSKQSKTFIEWNLTAVPRVREAVRNPIDRALGRALCDELYPGWRHRRERAA